MMNHEEKSFNDLYLHYRARGYPHSDAVLAVCDEILLRLSTWLTESGASAGSGD